MQVVMIGILVLASIGVSYSLVATRHSKNFLLSMIALGLLLSVAIGFGTINGLS